MMLEHVVKGGEKNNPFLVPISTIDSENEILVLFAF